MAQKYGPGGAKFKLPRYDGKTGKWSDVPPKTMDTDEEIELVETGQLYVLYAAMGDRVEANSPHTRRAIVAFTRTAIPQYNSYVDRHMEKKFLQSDGKWLPATLYHYHWKLSTFLESRKAGDSYNWLMELAAPFEPPADFPKDQSYDRYIASFITRDYPLHDEARHFFEQVRDGIVKPDYDSADDGDDANGSRRADRPAVDPDEVPF